MKAKNELKQLTACNAAIAWVGERTIEEAWKECKRGDWMLWYYAKTHPENVRELSLAKGLCANTVRHLMTDPRSVAAVDYAIAFGRGEVESDSAYTADAAAAADAAYAPHAAYAAAYAAAAAVAADADAHAAENNKLQTANICREVLKL